MGFLAAPRPRHWRREDLGTIDLCEDGGREWLFGKSTIIAGGGTLSKASFLEPPLCFS